MSQEKTKSHLSNMLDALVAGDDETAKAELHEHVVSKSPLVLEGCDPASNPGSKEVKATMKKTADEEIPKKGEAHDDPKKAPGEKVVKATMKKTGDEEIPKKGESHDDPKDAPGDKGVKATMKKTADEEIKA